jgi:methyl-accepting chemotaxis protein
MNHGEMVAKKNKILVVALAASIVLRCVVNAILLDVSSVLIPGIAGIVIVAIMAVLAWKLKNPYVVEYAMVGVFSILSIMCMLMYPCTTNMLMFFLAIFMVVIYEDIIPIVLQCVISSVCMIVFFNMYHEKLQNSWSTDALVMCIIYIISGMFVFAAMSYLSKKSFQLMFNMNNESDAAKNKAEGLLTEIGKSVGILGTTSGKIQESVTVTDEISKQIATAADDIAQRATEEVNATNAIRGKVENGVGQISNIAEASSQMTVSSEATTQTVAKSAEHVRTLQAQMGKLNRNMGDITKSITQLSEENAHIIEILGTLDSITSQTNLLSLNASIEAARAGEQGKGFAVVATEIRNLSESSKQFTEQIHDILNGVHDMTELVKEEILSGQVTLGECNEYMEEVGRSFGEIAENTASVLSQSQIIENRSAELGGLLDQTLNAANAISDSVASTSAAMEEISSSITELYGNIDSVVAGYKDINSITNSLVEVSQT